MEHTEYQQIMDRLEGRLLHYKNAAARKRAGRKQYTATQMELAKANAMQEARIIVWMFRDDEESTKCPECGFRHRPANLDHIVCDKCVDELSEPVASESQRIADETADGRTDGQAYNADVVAPATLEPESTSDVMAG